MAAARVGHCWVCLDGMPTEGRTCNGCRQMLRSEGHCKSGEKCGGRAGEGPFGSFCGPCWTYLADVFERLDARPVSRTPKVPTAKPEPAKPTPAEAAEKISTLVRERGQANKADLAQALGVGSQSRLLRAGLALAAERGLIERSRMGFTLPGALTATEQRAREIADAVKAEPGIKRVELAQRFGVPPAILSPAVRLARERGMIGGGRTGYLPA